MDLPEKIVLLHDTLREAGVPHAFGGALALAWCTGRARGTIDIDINVFLGVDAIERTLAALPDAISPTKEQRRALARDAQVRLWWGQTPVDLFLNTLPLHRTAQSRVRWERFMQRDIPFLACTDLAIFKAFFNRTKDWADLEEMAAAGTLNTVEVIGVLVEHLGTDDERIDRLRRLSAAI